MADNFIQEEVHRVVSTLKVLGNKLAWPTQLKVNEYMFNSPNKNAVFLIFTYIMKFIGKETWLKMEYFIGMNLKTETIFKNSIKKIINQINEEWDYAKISPIAPSLIATGMGEKVVRFVFELCTFTLKFSMVKDGVTFPKCLLNHDKKNETLDFERLQNFTCPSAHIVSLRNKTIEKKGLEAELFGLSSQIEEGRQVLNETIKKTSFLSEETKSQLVSSDFSHVSSQLFCLIHERKAELVKCAEIEEEHAKEMKKVLDLLKILNEKYTMNEEMKNRLDAKSLEPMFKSEAFMSFCRINNINLYRGTLLSIKEVVQVSHLGIQDILERLKSENGICHEQIFTELNSRLQTLTGLTEQLKCMKEVDSVRAENFKSQAKGLMDKYTAVGDTLPSLFPTSYKVISVPASTEPVPSTASIPDDLSPDYFLPADEAEEVSAEQADEASTRSPSEVFKRMRANLLRLKEKKQSWKYLDFPALEVGLLRPVQVEDRRATLASPQAHSERRKLKDVDSRRKPLFLPKMSPVLSASEEASSPLAESIPRMESLVFSEAEGVTKVNETLDMINLHMLEENTDSSEISHSSSKELNRSLNSIISHYKVVKERIQNGQMKEMSPGLSVEEASSILEESIPQMELSVSSEAEGVSKVDETLDTIDLHTTADSYEISHSSMELNRSLNSIISHYKVVKERIQNAQIKEMSPRLSVDEASSTLSEAIPQMESSVFSEGEDESEVDEILDISALVLRDLHMLEETADFLDISHSSSVDQGRSFSIISPYLANGRIHSLEDTSVNASTESDE